MAAIHSDEFKRDAVHIATTSGLTKRQVASDLGVGLSTLNKWVKMVSDESVPPDPDQNLLRENERLRRENRILKV
jgi:transposase